MKQSNYSSIVSISDAVKSQIKTTYLLLGQSSDYYWTDAYQIFIGDPSTSDPEAKQSASMLQDLFICNQRQNITCANIFIKLLILK